MLGASSMSKKASLERVFIPMLPEIVEPEVESLRAKVEQLSYQVVKRGHKLPILSSIKLDVLRPETLKGDPNEDFLVLMLTHG